jgi:hypothetical protein
MITEELLKQIRKLLSIFVTEVKASGAMGLTDINRVSENLFIPIFREVYGYKDIKNLNHAHPNYPAVDLGDEVRGVAVQITSTSSTKKVKSTLETFFKHNLERHFSRVVIYVLTEKQRQYSEKSFKDFQSESVRFHANKDIIDYRDLLRAIGNLDQEKLEKILEILNLNLGYEAISIQGKECKEEAQNRNIQSSEVNYLNLLELFLPEYIWIAELNIDRNKIIEQSKVTNRPLKINAGTRQVAHAALSQQGLQFSADWICYENKVITFHNLRDSEIPLSEIIDVGSAEPLKVNDFYSIDVDHESIFKMLLKKCLQQMLYPKGVEWQFEEQMFIFSETGDSPIRKELWKDKKESSRTVYERVMNINHPEKIFFCKHFGFRVRYRRFKEKWFLVISPDWFFSYDGYHRSFYHHEDKTSWLKRKETDKIIWNHLRFIVHFLKQDQENHQTNLLHDIKPYKFLGFGNLITFDNALLLNDQEWLPTKHHQEKLNSDSQTELLIEL